MRFLAESQRANALDDGAYRQAPQPKARSAADAPSREREGFAALLSEAVATDSKTKPTPKESVLELSGIVLRIVPKNLLRSIERVVFPVVIRNPVDDLVVILSLDGALMQVRTVPV